MDAKSMQQNEILEIAKKIASTKSKKQQEKLFIKLSEAIADNFEKNNAGVIEEAVSLSMNESPEITEIILDEVHLEIESICYDDNNGNDFDSTMQVMPFSVATKSKKYNLPSVNEFEKTIREHLLEAKIIETPEQFRLGTVLLSQEEMLQFSLQDWWHIHRDILDENDAEHKEENAKIREQRLEVTPDHTVAVFYLLPIIVNKDDNLQLMEEFYNSAIDADFWSVIGDKMSSAGMDITVYPPMGIVDTVVQSEAMTQDAEFDVFFDSYACQGVDIGYMQVAESPDDYAVLFIDSEDSNLIQFYYYKTQGMLTDFITVLVAKCIENKVSNLFSFDEQISKDTLKEWGVTDDEIDVYKLMQKSNQIDLNESHRMCMISSPTLCSTVESYSTKRTIH